MSNKIFFSTAGLFFFVQFSHAMEVAQGTSSEFETKSPLVALLTKIEEDGRHIASHPNSKDAEALCSTSPRNLIEASALRAAFYHQYLEALLSRIDGAKAGALLLHLMNAILPPFEIEAHRPNSSPPTSPTRATDIHTLGLEELAKHYAKLACLPHPQNAGLDEVVSLISTKVNSELSINDDLQDFLAVSYRFLNLKADSDTWINFCFGLIVESSTDRFDYNDFELACFLSAKGILKGWIQRWLEHSKGQNDFVRLLMRSSRSFTPLNAVAQAGSRSTAKLLVNAGADIAFKSESGDSPLMIASLNGNRSFVEWILRRLLKKFGGDNQALQREINTTNIEGCTALYYAVENGHDSVAEVLLKNGASLNSVSASLSPLLYLAIHSGSFMLVKLLVDHNADINEKYDESCPLNSAIIKCGLAEDKESFVNYSTDQIRERRAIFEFIFSHENFDRSIDFNPLIKTAYYFGLNEIAAQLENANNPKI